MQFRFMKVNVAIQINQPIKKTIWKKYDYNKENDYLLAYNNCNRKNRNKKLERNRWRMKANSRDFSFVLV
jgi:hypothetical protein